MIFTSNGGGDMGRDMVTGRPTGVLSGNGTFAAHPDNLRDRPIRTFYNKAPTVELKHANATDPPVGKPTQGAALVPAPVRSMPTTPVPS
eukprot:COSAG02_NODE_442_length_22243_cov_20.572887_2_plen_89_part_00